MLSLLFLVSHHGDSVVPTLQLIEHQSSEQCVARAIKHLQLGQWPPGPVARGDAPRLGEGLAEHARAGLTQANKWRKKHAAAGRQ